MRKLLSLEFGSFPKKGCKPMPAVTTPSPDVAVIPVNYALQRD